MRLVLGKDLFTLIKKYIEYHSEHSEGGRELTMGERAYLGRILSRIGEKLIFIIMKGK